jgi:hypothetical protein
MTPWNMQMPHDRRLDCEKTANTTHVGTELISDLWLESLKWAKIKKAFITIQSPVNGEGDPGGDIFRRHGYKCLLVWTEGKGVRAHVYKGVIRGWVETDQVWPTNTDIRVVEEWSEKLILEEEG